MTIGLRSNSGAIGIGEFLAESGYSRTPIKAQMLNEINLVGTETTCSRAGGLNKSLLSLGSDGTVFVSVKPHGDYSCNLEVKR